MNLANTIKAMSEAKQDFEPHMMYDPETGKGYKAEKPEDHERMKKMGYTHEKPEEDESEDETDLDEAFEALLDANESVNENLVMRAQFKVGDMPNSDLHNSIEKLKTAKKKAEAQKPKVSDPVLVKSLDDVISEIDKTIKAAEKVQSGASKAIAKVAPSIKKTFELISRKKYLVASAEVEGDAIEEAKSSSGYELYHRDFSGAMQHAYAFAKKKGYVVDKDDIDQKVAFGPKKPSSGKTNKYILGTNKKQNVHIQVANLDNKRYELNMYIESVELDEAKFGDNDLVHIAKANVRGNNNPKTDKIIGYSKAPKNPNKFPDPKSGANSIMRIADAKKKGFKIESAELNEDYFMVQYYDKKGKADTTKFSKFDNEQKAKKYLDRANKAEKEGEYKMFKVKGRMEGLEEATAAKKVYTKKVGQSTVNVYQYADKKMIAMFTSKGFGETSYGIKKLDKKAIDGAVKHFDDNKGLLGGSLDTISESANPNFFGTKANYGSSDSLLAAVNAVVTGQAETVETTVEDQNEIIENGSDEIVESADLEEAFASFSVPIPAQTLSGKKIGGGKTPIVVKARTAREAIQKAAKQLGVDFKMLKTGKVMKEDNTNDDSDDGEGLDKVQPKAVKKKFKDRKDQDIDNDGDVDDSDKFLHKKRKAISKAISKDESKEKDDKKKDKKADEVDTSPSLDEALKNPYKKFSERDLKRKLASFESQLQDLIKKSKGRQRKEIEGEIRDMETKVQQVRSALKESISESLDQEMFKAKYGSRWESVMEATIKRLAEQQELNEKFTLLKDKDIAPLVLALKDNISVELKDPKNNNLLVTMQTTDDGVQVKYKTGRNTKVGTERSPMPAIKSAVKFLKAKELAFREL